MKRLFFSFILFAFFLLLPKDILAYQQTESICYSQCAAYKFIWQGTYCWDDFAQNCGVDKGNSILKTIKFLKDIYDTLTDFDGIDRVFTAWYKCKPLIENCIVPRLQDCRQTCQTDKYTYASDLSVGHPESSFQGVYYDETTKQLYFKLVNNGMGYAWDIDVEAKVEVTQKRDNSIEVTKSLFKEKVEHLIYLGARNGPPKSFSDNVQDFLVEESLNGQYLHDFKSWVVDSLDLHSDSKNYNVPNYWIKAVPFTPLPGWLNRITFKVDPSQFIPELWEQNNTFVLDVDLRPTPARFTILEGNLAQLVDGTLNSFNIHFGVKNTGEENGYAIAKIYEGKYQDGKTPIYQNAKSIPGKDYLSWDTTISFDPKNENKPYCGNSKGYTLVIFDEDGNKTEKSFSLPMYIGSVNGRVEDLFGKKVVGATIKASTGEETTVNSMGYYHLKGITTLGKITISATHPDFSQPTSQEIEFKYGNEFDACKEGNLLFNSVNFVLKDQDVMFMVTVKDRSGNNISAHVLASNADWRFEQDVNGATPLPGMQPCQYFFTISAPGYKTIGQTINAVPNNQNLEFILEKLNGRLTDEGLSTHPPQLLWQMERGEEILSKVAATKDGKRIIMYTTKNKANTGKLYFLDLETGNKIKEISGIVATGGNSYACLDASHDGNTTALYVYDRTAGTRNTRNVLKLYNSQGQEFGTTEFKPGNSASECDVSPDGFYIFPNKLMNKGLYVYTRHDIYGIENSRERVSYSSGELHFTTANNIVSGCPKIGQCVHTFNNTVVTDIGDIKGGIFKIDSNQDASKIVFSTVNKAYLFSNGAKSWEKDIKIYGDEADISVSPGGKYVIYSTTFPTNSYRTIRIFTDNNIDKTPSGLPHAGREEVVFVHANDKGIYFLTNYHKTLKFYKVGSYSVNYNPPTGVPTTTETVTSGLSYYLDSTYYPVSTRSFSRLEEGFMYVANHNINLDMSNGLGSLFILEGTIFSVDANHRPILLKGQLTADFSSPAVIYAIKFDRFDMNLFKTKLNQFRLGTLSSDEYFVVKNIHTKFMVRNNPNNFNMAVENGQVDVTANKTIKTISSGKQITIDGENKIKESIYISSKIYVIIIGALILVLSIVLFIYRKTKAGETIINTLKKLMILFWKIIKTISAWVWKMICKIAPILWRKIKVVCQNLINIIKKLVKKNKS